MPPNLIVTLADLEWDDASLLDAVAAAFPPRRVSWDEGNPGWPMVTIARTGFGQPITVRPSRYEPDNRGLVDFTVDLAHIDGFDDEAWDRGFARYREASIDLADRVRPMLMVRVVELSVENLHDADSSDDWLFRGGWACPDRMDERRANGFRRAFADIEHRTTPAGVAWSTTSDDVAERLRLAWTRKPPEAPTRRHHG